MVVEEFDAIDDTTEHVFTTGAPDMIREAFEIITALQQYTPVELPIEDVDDVGC